MTGPTRDFPDVETVLIALIQGSGIVAQVGADLPENLQYRMPFALVVRSGGGDDGISDFPTVDVELYTNLKTDGKRLSEHLRQRLTRPMPGWPLDRIETVGAITELPFGGRNVRRWSNTFRATTRRVTTA